MSATLDWTKSPTQPIPNSMSPRKSARLYLVGAGILFMAGLLLPFFVKNSTIDFAIGYAYFVVSFSHFTFLCSGYFLFVAFVCWLSLAWLNKRWLVTHFTITLTYYFLAFFLLSNSTLSILNSRYYTRTPDSFSQHQSFIPVILGVCLLLQIMWFIHWAFRFYKSRVKRS